jgi:hypothetical protein
VKTIEECLQYITYIRNNRVLAFMSFQVEDLKSERMLISLPSQKCHDFLSLQMKIVMRNLSMLTLALELQIVPVSQLARNVYLFL